MCDEYKLWLVKRNETGEERLLCKYLLSHSIKIIKWESKYSLHSRLLLMMEIGQRIFFLINDIPEISL